jgi:hypothetical protein
MCQQNAIWIKAACGQGLWRVKGVAQEAKPGREER